jgi:beta-glucosidase
LYTRDKVAKTPEEAVRMAVLAGLDMSMVPYDYTFTDICIDLVKKDKEFSNRVNDAVLRILKVKEKLGLWSKDSLYPVASEAQKVGNDDFHAKNLEAARESIILAKNEMKLLPLNKMDTTKRIVIIGPTGNLLKCLNGGWTYTWQGDNEDNNKNFGRSNKQTVYSAIRSKQSNTLYFQGVSFDNTTDFNTAIQQANQSDIIILTIGEETYTETPGNINSLFLNQEQYDLADALFQTKKPVIVVYLGGRPRVITEIVNKAQAVIFGFLPGNRGGEAIADVIFGDYNPNGRLPITFPLSPNGFITYDRKPLEVYVDESDPLAFSQGGYINLYPYAHGLSYTNYSYSNLKLSPNTIDSPKGQVDVSIDVTNIGDRDGKETVILYLNDEFGSVSRPVREVKGFKKVSLKAKETQTVQFTLKNEDFSFINRENKRVVEGGAFHVYFNNFDGNATFTVRVMASEANSNMISNIFLLFSLISTFLFH